MRFHLLSIGALCVAVIPLTGCAFVSAQTLAAVGEEQALTLAAKACTDALADQASGQGENDLIYVRSQAADLAAEAANADPRWDPLVEAASRWQQVTRDLVEATENIGDLTMMEMSILGENTTEAQQEMQTECRKVRAAGGSVDTMDDLND